MLSKDVGNDQIQPKLVFCLTGLEGGGAKGRGWGGGVAGQKLEEARSVWPKELHACSLCNPTAPWDLSGKTFDP